MGLLPVFPIRLLMLILPVAAAVVILAIVGGRGVGVLKKQGVAWGLTALMIVAAVGIGYGKAHASVKPEEAPQPYVRDDAGVLSYNTLTQLTQRNQRLYDKYGVVVAVVTCNYGKDDLYNYALKRAEALDLRGYDFIVVLDIKGDNYWLLQGADLVDDFTDEDCEYYAWDYMEQAFAGGDYDRAVLKLATALEAWYGTYFG